MKGQIAYDKLAHVKMELGYFFITILKYFL